MLEAIRQEFGEGLADESGHGPHTLFRVLKELQGLNVKDVAGGAAATPIALAGIGVNDTILAALAFQGPAAVSGDAFTNVTADASIPSAGHVQFSVDTTGTRVLIVSYTKPVVTE